MKSFYHFRLCFISISLSFVLFLPGCAERPAPAAATLPFVEPTTESAMPFEPTQIDVTEPSETAPTKAPAPQIDNRCDQFLPGKLCMNHTEYTLPAGIEEQFIAVMNEGYYTYYDTAFYVLDLGTQMSFGYEADAYFSPACTRKAGLALAWYKLLEKNRLDHRHIPPPPGQRRYMLNDWYYYDGSDFLKGSGVVAYNGYGYYTIKDLLHYMIYTSDNTAYQALWNLLGIEDYIELENALGIPDFWEPARNNKLWTPMRPLDLGLIWQEIWAYKQTGSPEAELFWHELTHNLFCEIGKVVQGADEIAHKSGFDEYGYHDAGIVVRGENAYVVVAMSKRPLSIVNEDDDCIHHVIALIDVVMQDYYAWLENRE